MNNRKKIVVFSAFLIFSIFAVLALQHKYKQIEADFFNHTHQISQDITKEMKSTQSYLDVLNKSSDFVEYLKDRRSADNKKKVENLFSNTITRSPSYDQVRYIDETGYESIRINYRDEKVTIVPENFHQQKNNRYYFSDTMKLKKGEVYLSPLDLNIEKGQIEEPYIPTIRMSTPVFDSNGNSRGILIVNYRAQEILNHLVAPDNLSKYVNTYLLNSEEYWIKGPTPKSEWGFMFSDRQDEKYEKYFPLSRNEIKENDDGNLVNREGVFFWVKFFPIEDIRPKDESGNPHLFYHTRFLATKDFHLTIIAHSTLSQIIRYLIDFN